MSLEHIIKEHIQENGYITIAGFMDLALSHPAYGYYMTCDPFGKSGDFVTSPEISQIFGELLGIWCVHLWQQKGSPKDVALVEIGGGRGTLMSDLLRITKNIEGFHESISVYMVETSEKLQHIQQAALNAYDVDIQWFDDFHKIEDKTIFLIANELFDALPIEQYIFDGSKWQQQVIIWDNEFKFSTIKCDDIREIYLCKNYPYAEKNSVIEISPTSDKLMGLISGHIATNGGGALIIDYGYGKRNKPEELKDTLQAVSNHQYSNILENIGTSDITAHVNFNNLLEVANRYDVACSDIVTQQELLYSLGIEHRLSSLLSSSPEYKRENILHDAQRLIGTDHMGVLFKAIIVTDNKDTD